MHHLQIYSDHYIIHAQKKPQQHSMITARVQ